MIYEKKLQIKEIEETEKGISGQADARNECMFLNQIVNVCK